MLRPIGPYSSVPGVGRSRSKTAHQMRRHHLTDKDFLEDAADLLGWPLCCNSPCPATVAGDATGVPTNSTGCGRPPSTPESPARRDRRPLDNGRCGTGKGGSQIGKLADQHGSTQVATAMPKRSRTSATGQCAPATAFPESTYVVQWPPCDRPLPCGNPSTSRRTRASCHRRRCGVNLTKAKLPRMAHQPSGGAADFLLSDEHKCHRREPPGSQAHQMPHPARRPP